MKLTKKQTRNLVIGIIIIIGILILNNLGVINLSQFFSTVPSELSSSGSKVIGGVPI